MVLSFTLGQVGQAAMFSSDWRTVPSKSPPFSNAQALERLHSLSLKKVSFFCSFHGRKFADRPLVSFAMASSRAWSAEGNSGLPSVEWLADSVSMSSGLDESKLPVAGSTTRSDPRMWIERIAWNV